jgi:hypothetical protein
MSTPLLEVMFDSQDASLVCTWHEVVQFWETKNMLFTYAEFVSSVVHKSQVD